MPNAEGDILGNRQPGHQPRFLKDYANLRTWSKNRGPIQRDGACRWLIQTGNQAQQGTLATTRTTDDDQDFTLLHRKGEIGQCQEVVRVAFLDLTDFKHVPPRIESHPANVANVWPGLPGTSRSACPVAQRPRSLRGSLPDDRFAGHRSAGSRGHILPP